MASFDWGDVQIEMVDCRNNATSTTDMVVVKFYPTTLSSISVCVCIISFVMHTGDDLKFTTLVSLLAVNETTNTAKRRKELLTFIGFE